MAIPVGTSLEQWFNTAVNDLNQFAYKFRVYDEDWATLPAAVKTAIRARAVTVITDSKAKLDDVLAAIQAQA